MLDTLDRLRTHSSARRQQYAVAGAAVLTGCIVLIWFSTLSGRLQSDPAEVAAARSVMEENSGAFAQYRADFKRNFGHLFSGASGTNTATSVPAAAPIDPAQATGIVLPTLTPSNKPLVPQQVLIATSSVSVATSTTAF